MSSTVRKRLGLLGALIIAGSGIAYASFVSNTVTLGSNALTTGEASLKLCDTEDKNQWLTAVNPTLNISRMLPDEERDLLGQRLVYVGNDNSKLAANFTNNHCQVYGETAGNSNTPLKLTPSVVFQTETCPTPLPSNIKLRFNFNDQPTEYKTLTSWSSNTTAFEPVITPGSAALVSIFAQLSSTTSVQSERCQFTINLTGKQA